jgi:hypothetical protein
MKSLAPYAKAVAAFIVGAIVFAGGLLVDGDWTKADTVTLLGWISATVAVYQTPNRPVAETGGPANVITTE